jgi:hypothetical protein
MSRRPLSRAIYISMAAAGSCPEHCERLWSPMSSKRGKRRAATVVCGTRKRLKNSRSPRTAQRGWPVVAEDADEDEQDSVPPGTRVLYSYTPGVSSLQVQLLLPLEARVRGGKRRSETLRSYLGRPILELVTITTAHSLQVSSSPCAYLVPTY